MIRIYIPNNSRQSIGGGWTFLQNIKSALDAEFVTTVQEADLVLITGATMTQRSEIMWAKDNGIPVAFRVDNIPKDSRNRGTAFSRMLDFAKVADLIIFQSEWARDYAGWWFEDNGVDITNKSVIIYNGVDASAFYEDETERVKDRYLYVQFNRDENKRMPEAFYTFHQAHRKNKEAELYLIGQFSSELINYNFDFFAGENITYLGVIDHREQLGDMMRSCEYLLFPAFADAAPNTVQEAVACGCKVIGVNEVGGTKEVLSLGSRTIQDMANDYKVALEKLI